MSCFDRCGLAAKSDLETDNWRSLFAVMEKEQARFLASESLFRSRAYRWPRDPLHTWSRIWEYPFAYHHLREWSSSRGAVVSGPIVDLGSGVTFFPFLVAKLGRPVICVDIDPVVAQDLERAGAVVDASPGGVSFRQTDGRKLAFANEEVDTVYCISVLEHVPEPELVIDEIERILRPNGRLLLTMDLDLRGDQEIGVKKRRELMLRLRRGFTLSAREETVHPADILRSDNGPYCARSPRSLGAIFWATHNWLRRGKFDQIRNLFRVPFLLAVEGLVLTKK